MLSSKKDSGNYLGTYSLMSKMLAEHGYALAVSDDTLDSDDRATAIAVPWLEDATDPDVLISLMTSNLAIVTTAEPELMHHGRTMYSLLLAYIPFKLCVMPKVTHRITRRIETKINNHTSQQKDWDRIVTLQITKRECGDNKMAPYICKAIDEYRKGLHSDENPNGNFGMSAEETIVIEPGLEIFSTIVGALNLRELQRVCQWFTILKDMNGAMVLKEDYEIAEKIQQKLGCKAPGYMAALLEEILDAAEKKA
jgi:hypothetical protein